MEQRAKFLIAKARELGPVTVRGLYYQAEVAGIPGITKADGDYNKVQQQVLKLRRAGRLPYRHISDLTRWMRKPSTFDGVEDILQSTVATYRKSLWSHTKDYVEIWCEKDALAGTIYPVTSEYDVPLMVTRGFSSETFAFSAIEAREDDTRDYYVYYLGDFDRAGQDAADSLWEKLSRFHKEFKCQFEMTFDQLAVTEEQIQEMGLSTREPKRKSAADIGWPYDFACELDAIDANTLRDIVRECIEQHLPKHELEILKVAEESEREQLRIFVDRYNGGGDDPDNGGDDDGGGDAPTDDGSGDETEPEPRSDETLTERFKRTFGLE
jgi:hypothetical protein